MKNFLQKNEAVGMTALSEVAVPGIEPEFQE